MPEKEDAGLGDVERGIQEWLGKQGYELEHVVANAMRQAGYVIVPGVQVGDATGASRETDVIGIEPTTEAAREVRLLVECKHARKPWIVRTTKDLPGPIERIDDLALHRDAVRPLREELAGRGSDLPIDLGTRELGFSIIEGPQTDPTQHETGKPNTPYQALQQLTSAVRALAAEKSVYDNPWALFPVLVIEGSLWSLAYEPGSKAKPIQMHKVRWEGLGPPLLIDVVTRPALEDYLYRMRESTTWLSQWMGGLPRPGPGVAWG